MGFTRQLEAGFEESRSKLLVAGVLKGSKEEEGLLEGQSESQQASIGTRHN